jgi:hypothetical protein
MTTTMQQKITWMLLYLSFGISIITQTYSCRKDHGLKTEWIYINETDSAISYFPSSNYLNIPAKGTTVYKSNIEASKDVSVGNISPEFNARIIYYGSNYCDSINIDEGPRNIKNYQTEKLGTNNFRLTYRFTKAMLLKADSCK